jgi:hypothetical protein
MLEEPPAVQFHKLDNGQIKGNRSLFIPQIQKNEAERTLFIPQIGNIEGKRSLFIPQIRKFEAEWTWLIPEIGKIEVKKTNWIEVKRTEALFLKLLWSPGIISKDYALAGLYNNPIPDRFLAPLNYSKVSASCWYF